MLQRLLVIAMPALLLASSGRDAAADVTLSRMVGRLEVVAHADGSATISLLAGGPLGLGGLAGGLATDVETEAALWLAGIEEVSGVEPTPFFPVGEGDYSGVQPTPFAPDDERVLSFEFDRSGRFSGIQPTPFRIYLFTPSGLVGELRFEDVLAEQGSLILTGVVLDEAGGMTPVPTFTLTGLPPAVPVSAAPGLWAMPALMGATAIVLLRRHRPVPGPTLCGRFNARSRAGR